MSSEITITLWNASGLAKQAATPILSILDFSTLIFITETWLLPPSRYPIQWQQYHTYGQPVPNTKRGQMGIALLVHPDCPYPVHHIPTTSPYLFSCQIADILIHCVYLPPSASYSNDDAISFIESLPLSTHPSQTNTIICGDFNARIRGLLGDSRSNTRGTALYDFIMHNNITCWNATLAYGQPTYHSFTNEREDTSIIDLFLSTNPLDSPSIAIENDMDLGSDHKPVRLTFTPSSPAPPPQQHPRQLWHLSKLSDPEIRQQYGTHLTTNIQPVLDSLTLAIDNNDTPPDIDALSTMFTDAIHHALDTSIGRKKPGTRDNSNKWFWNDELQTAFERREYCYQRLRHADEIERPFWVEQHNDAKRHMRSLIASRKRETWKQFCEKLAKDDFGKTTATIKRIRQRRMTSHTFTHPNAATAAANTMANHLKTVYAGSSLPTLRPSPPPLEPGPHNIDHHPFSVLEVKEAIEHAARRKAPGVDHPSS